MESSPLPFITAVRRTWPELPQCLPGTHQQRIVTLAWAQGAAWLTPTTFVFGWPGLLTCFRPWPAGLCLSICMAVLAANCQCRCSLRLFLGLRVRKSGFDYWLVTFSGCRTSSKAFFISLSPTVLFWGRDIIQEYCEEWVGNVPRVLHTLPCP